MEITNCKTNIKKIDTDLFLVTKLKILTIFLLLLQIFTASNAFSIGKKEDGSAFPNCTGPSGNSTQPRLGCQDLIHLPLCSAFNNENQNANNQQFTPISNISDPNINCVKECSTINSQNNRVRGDDYAVHNEDCIRFCPIEIDNSGNMDVNIILSNGITTTINENGAQVTWTDSNPKCVMRYCHQLPDNIDPIPLPIEVTDENGIVRTRQNNCNLAKCHYLKIEELAEDHPPLSISPETNLSDITKEPKFGSAHYKFNLDKTPKKYCDFNNEKCYNFSKNKLPYFMRDDSDALNLMCQIHECDKNPSRTDACNSGANDSINIENQEGLTAGYENDYRLYIDDTYKDPEAPSLECTPILCKPIMQRNHFCTEDGSGNFTIPNTNCDNACIDGACTEEIDCNSSPEEEECIELTPENSNTDYEYVLSIEDYKSLSWFYRPKPPKTPHVADQITDSRFSNVTNIVSLKMEHLDEDFSNLANRINENFSEVGINISENLLSIITANNNLYKEMCYTIAQMENNGWGFRKGLRNKYKHPQANNFLGTGETGVRSPGFCEIKGTGLLGREIIEEGKRSASRSGGYEGLCTDYDNYIEDENVIYYPKRNDIAYNFGYAKPFVYNQSGNHLAKQGTSIVSCLRFNNYFISDVNGNQPCGARECFIDCTRDKCKTQRCGMDECVILSVSEDDVGDRCADPLTADENSCAIAIGGKDTEDAIVGEGKKRLGDKRIRIRAVRYPPIMNKETGEFGLSRLCTFLDHKTTNRPQINRYMRGTEKLSDGTCIDPNAINSNPENPQLGVCEGGFNYNEEGKTFKPTWRAERLINQVSQDYKPLYKVGTKIRKGRTIKAQECAFIPLKKGPPRWYKIANVNNSLNLFLPPVFVSEIKDSSNDDALKSSDGQTDFHYPSIEVTLGDKEKTPDNTDSLILKLSEKENKTEDDKLEVILGAEPYSVFVFAQKEYDGVRSQPVYCVYRRDNADGTPVIKKLECIDRRKPAIDSTDGKYKTIISKEERTLTNEIANNEFTATDLKLQLMFAGTSINDTNCGGTVNSTKCIDQVTFSHEDLGNLSTVCKSIGEEYVACAQKDPCTELLDECVQNEINQSRFGDSQETVEKQNFCNNELLRNCNLRWGIVNDDMSSIYDFLTNIDENGVPANSNNQTYGWFNEICMVRGYEEQLKNVIAYASNEFGIGKCLIDPANDDNCSDEDRKMGGNASTGCNCIEAQEDMTNADLQSLNTIETQFEIRKQTPREGGLCVDIKIPKFCPAIDFGESEFDSSGKDTSLGKTNLNEIHQSHKDRTIGHSNGLVSNIHAEFNPTFAGVSAINGKCNGFWKSISNNKKPTLNCGADGKWRNIEYDCVRYSCPAKITSGVTRIIGAGNIGEYPSNYSPNGEIDPGSSHGYANWAEFTHTTDLAIYIDANTCITGYKRIGSDPQVNEQGDIFGFSGGKNPRRLCNQKGDWMGGSNISDPCQRIQCVAPTVENRTSESVLNDILNDPYRANNTLVTSLTDRPELDDNWRKFGSSIFLDSNNNPKTALSSRSRTEYLVTKNENISLLEATGQCFDGSNDGDDNDVDLVFFPTGSPTKLSCDHLGNFVKTNNGCSTSCNAVTELSNPGLSDGFALWSKIEFPEIGGTNTINLEANSCRIGYFPNPYPFPQNTNIDYDISNPLKTDLPTRNCSAHPSGTAVWDDEDAKNPCVNTCPGFSENPTLNIGKTEVRISEDFYNRHKNNNSGLRFKVLTRDNNYYAHIEWPKDTDIGDIIYYSYDGNNDQMDTDSINVNVSNFGDDNKLLLSRKCGSKGKWETPVILCSKTNGTLKNAIYNSSTEAIDVLELGSPQTVTATNCISGHEQDGDSLPIRNCVYKDNKQNINEITLKLANEEINDCKKRICRTQKNIPVDTINDIKYYGNINQEWTTGDVVELSCPDAGYKIGTTSKFVTPSVGNCFSSYSDRITTAPTVTCQEDGTFSDIENKCSVCRGCDRSSPADKQQDPITRTEGCGGVCKSSTISASIQELINNTILSVPHNTKFLASKVKNICTNVSRLCSRYNSPRTLSANAKCTDNYIDINP